MAGPTWGEAEIAVTADGTLLNSSIRRLATAAGNSAGADLVRAFNTQLGRMGNGFQDQLERMNDHLSTQERIVDRLNRSWLRLWRTLPHGFRQFTFYTTLFTNLGGSIATLGSAAGAGLAIISAAAIQSVIGLGVFATAFIGLLDDIESLPPEVQPAARALQRLGDEFQTLHRAIQVAVLKDAERAFDLIGNTVRALTPAFVRVGEVAGRLLDDFATNIQPGTRGFQVLYDLIDQSAAVFDRVARLVGRLALALGDAFTSPAIQRGIQELLDWVEDLIDAFDEFVQSDQLEVWANRASQVFGAVGDLLEAVGKALNNLVDEGSTARLVAFLNDLTAFMPALEDLLSILDELNIFGIIAHGLAIFGAAMEPLVEPLHDLAAAIAAIFMSAIDTLGPIFEEIARGLAPLVQAVADFLAADPHAVANALIALAGAAVLLKGASGLAGLLDAFRLNIVGLATGMKDNDWKGLGAKMGKAGSAAFLTALITGLLSGEGGAGATIATATIAGLSVGGLPGMVAGALIGSIVSAFTDPGSWANGAEQIATFFNEGLGGILNPESWSNGWEQIKEFNRIASEEIAAGFETSWTEWGAKFENGRQQINTGVSLWWEELMAAFANGGAQIALLWDTLMLTLGTLWTTFWTGLTTAMSNGWNQIVTFFTESGTTVSTLWNTIWTTLGVFFTEAWNNILLALSNGWNQIVVFFTEFGNTVSTIWTGFWTAITTFLSTTWTAIQTALVNGWNQIISFFTSGSTTVSAQWTTFWTNLWTFVTQVWTNIQTALVNGWNQIVSFFSSFIATVTNLWNSFWNNVNALLASAWAMIQNTVQTGWNAVTNFFSSFINSVTSMWNNFWNTVNSILNNAWNQIRNAVNGGWAGVQNLFSNFIGQVQSMWNNFWNNLMSFLQGAWGSIQGIISGAWNNIAGMFGHFIGYIAGVWNNGWNQMLGTVQAIWNAIAGAVGGAINNIRGMINGFIGAINSAISAVNNLSGGIVNLPALPRLAKGGITMGPSLAGEAGPEMVIPLTGPLSMVNPSVRRIAAMIRGEGGERLSQAGVGGGGRITNVMPGAVQVTSVATPMMVAGAVVDRLDAAIMNAQN